MRYPAMSKIGLLLIRHFSRKHSIRMRTSSEPFPDPHKSHVHTVPQKAANACQNLRITEQLPECQPEDPKGLSHLIAKLQKNMNKTLEVGPMLPIQEVPC